LPPRRRSSGYQILEDDFFVRRTLAQQTSTLPDRKTVMAECIIEREAGSAATVGGKTIWFIPPKIAPRGASRRRFIKPDPE